MTQYLVQWAHGSFQTMTGEQLRKEIDEGKKAPSRIYRLIPNQDPQRLFVIWCNAKHDIWYLVDAFNNLQTL